MHLEPINLLKHELALAVLKPRDSRQQLEDWGCTVDWVPFHTEYYFRNRYIHLYYLSTGINLK